MLGPAKRHWDAFLIALEKRCPRSKRRWKRYAGPSGLQLVVEFDGRNLVYLKPAECAFGAASALSAAAVAAAGTAGLPADFVAALRQAPTFREGVPARVRIITVKDLRIAVELLRLKLEA